VAGAAATLLYAGGFVGIRSAVDASPDASAIISQDGVRYACDLKLPIKARSRLVEELESVADVGPDMAPRDGEGALASAPESPPRARSPRSLMAGVLAGIAGALALLVGGGARRRRAGLGRSIP
jgi:hypothetical protein